MWAASWKVVGVPMWDVRVFIVVTRCTSGPVWSFIWVLNRWTLVFKGVRAEER
eukprot:SAG11_NODE_1025_length_6147_cov_54.005622_3_plen_53_part_00